MTSGASNLPEHGSTRRPEARAAPSADDPVAAQLRGFGPLGLLAILVIVLASAVKPLGGLLVLCGLGNRIRHGATSATCVRGVGLAVWPSASFSAARLNS